MRYVIILIAVSIVVFSHDAITDLIMGLIYG